MRKRPQKTVSHKRAAWIQSSCQSRKEDMKTSQNGSQVRLCYWGRFFRRRPGSKGVYEARYYKGKSFFDKNKNKINLYNGGTITRKYTILVLRQQKTIFHQEKQQNYSNTWKRTMINLNSLITTRPPSSPWSPTKTKKIKLTKWKSFPKVYKSYPQCDFALVYSRFKMTQLPRPKRDLSSIQ